MMNVKIKYTQDLPQKCRKCEQFLKISYIEFVKNRTLKYDMIGRPWHGRTCPDCHVEKTIETRALKTPKVLEIKSCLVCKKEGVKRKYCSHRCLQKFHYLKTHPDAGKPRPKKPKVTKPKKMRSCRSCSNEMPHQGMYCSNACKPIHVYPKKPKPVVILSKTCGFCKAEFETKHSNKRFCDRLCKKRALLARRFKGYSGADGLSKKERLYARNRRMKEDSRMPDWCDVKRLNEFYMNCPEGKHVDHIVPLHGENVSGLHVHWNLQYLDPQTNLRKNCFFDGTYDNLNWANKANRL